REKDAFVVPHDHVFDHPFAVDQHTNLAIDLKGQLAEIPRQLLGDDLLRWYLATIDMLEPMDLIGLQARQIAVYQLNRRSPLGAYPGDDSRVSVTPALSLSHRAKTYRVRCEVCRDSRDIWGQNRDGDEVICNAR